MTKWGLFWRGWLLCFVITYAVILFLILGFGAADVSLIDLVAQAIFPAALGLVGGLVVLVIAAREKK